MSRKQPVGYEVRRPLTLWGKRREIGEYLPAEEVASMARIESMVRAGRFVEVFDKPKVKTTKRRGKSTSSVTKQDKPVGVVIPKPKPVEMPKVESPSKPIEIPKREVYPPVKKETPVESESTPTEGDTE